MNDPWDHFGAHGNMSMNYFFGIGGTAALLGLDTHYFFVENCEWWNIGNFVVFIYVWLEEKRSGKTQGRERKERWLSLDGMRGSLSLGYKIPFFLLLLFFIYLISTGRVKKDDFVAQHYFFFFTFFFFCLLCMFISLRISD